MMIISFGSPFGLDAAADEAAPVISYMSISIYYGLAGAFFAAYFAFFYDTSYSDGLTVSLACSIFFFF